jgi:hypothetical protein
VTTDDDPALQAVRSGITPPTRSDFEDGRARAVAVDVADDVAGVLVIQHFVDGDWDLDVATCIRVAGEWTDAGSGGATTRELPLDWDLSAPAARGPGITTWWRDDDRAFVIVGGLVIGDVAEMELVTDLGARRISIRPYVPGYVIVAQQSVAAFAGSAGPTIRAYDSDGLLVDD